jgi:hypothetical protein
VRSNPNKEISDILRFVNPEEEPVQEHLKGEIISRPSRTTVTAGRAVDLGSWENEFSSQQIDAGRGILDAFGFGGLYDRNPTPDRTVLEKNFM